MVKTTTSMHDYEYPPPLVVCNQSSRQTAHIETMKLLNGPVGLATYSALWLNHTVYVTKGLMLTNDRLK